MAGLYKQSGVDIAAGDRFAAMIAEQGKVHGIKTDIGGFAGSFPIPAGTARCGGSVDGVGTKLTLLTLMRKYFVAGVDAAAMAGVDMYVAGMRPVAGFDYIVAEHLDPEAHIELVMGIMSGCQQLGCEYLPGGETAEHPNVGLPKGHIDLGMFFVGVPDPALPTNPKERIKPGMKVWGWLSYGLGSNGYSLARQVLKLDEGFFARVSRAILGGEYGIFSGIKLRLTKQRRIRYYDEAANRQCYMDTTLADLLLERTRIYVKDVERLRVEGVEFCGHAHITGGGLPGNVPRILPDDCMVRIPLWSWQTPPIFNLIKKKGRVDDQEMDRVFNMGIQMVSVTPPDVEIRHPHCRLIGTVEPRDGSVQVRYNES